MPSTVDLVRYPSSRKPAVMGVNCPGDESEWPPMRHTVALERATGRGMRWRPL